jgi:hypothetical protein
LRAAAPHALSATGAAIELDGLVALPPSFTLSIAYDQAVHRCRTVWRSDKRIGLEFVH